MSVDIDMVGSDWRSDGTEHLVLHDTDREDSSPEISDGIATAERSLYRWISSCSEALVTARREFGGDLDRLVIYLVFVQAELSGRSSGRERMMNGVNALSVADITLVPRETTRRKLHDLALSGHIRRGVDGLWYLDDTLQCEAWIAGAKTIFDQEFKKRLQA